MSDWILSVAEVLPLPHRSELPYTLGEAIAELGAYANAVGARSWTTRRAKDNRASLGREIKAQSETLGNRLAALLTPLLDDLSDDTEPSAVVAVAARFAEAWHSEAAVTEAFRDLCDAAQVSGATSRTLRKRSAIIASQVGPAAQGPLSLLNQAANALVDTEQDMALMRGISFSGPLTEERRLEMAREILVDAPVGRVTVWVAYYRAIVSEMRAVAGPMVFLEAAWALPNAFENGPIDFPERAELRDIREDARWLDDLHAEALKPENRLVLVRLDLGERQLAGAVESALHQIEAALSIAVEAGGVSWQSTGSYVVLLDGKVRNSTLGATLHDTRTSDDSYGMRATADMLSNIVDQLGDSLAKGPMPEQLVEALTALREARMTEHRDVSVYGTRSVTPRVATALEDHAMELIASVLNVQAQALAIALQRREALNQARRRVARQLMAPFDNAWAQEHHESREQLERQIASFSHGRRSVSVAKTAALAAEIRTLPMTELQRADFENALLICTDPNHEQELLDESWRDTVILRARHRRVRNAVNHGLPLGTTALNSVREYAYETSRAALNMALTWYKNGELGSSLVQREQAAWADQNARIARGISWAAEEEQAGDDSIPEDEH